MLSEWTKYKDITITNPSGSDLRDYQIKTTINVHNMNCRSDLGDLRFAQGSTLLPYWLRNDGNGIPTTIDGKIITPVGNVTQTTVNGVNCISFDGSGDRLGVGSLADWKFLHDGSTSWTISIRIKNLTLGSQAVLVDTCNGTTIGHGMFIAIQPNRSIKCGIVNGVDGNPVYGMQTTANMYPNDSNSHVITFELDITSQILYFYLDNTLIQIANKQPGDYSSSNPSNILNISGHLYSGTWYGYINGNLQEVYIDKQKLYTGDTISIPDRHISTPTTALLLHGNNVNAPTYFVDESTGNYECFIKVPLIPTTGTTIRMFYDNENSLTISNPHNVFDFYDGFETGKISPEKWPDGYANYTITTTSPYKGTYSAYRDGSQAYIESKYLGTLYDDVIEMAIKISQTNKELYPVTFLYGGDLAYIFCVYGNGYFGYGISGTSHFTSHYVANTWYKIKLVLEKSNDQYLIYVNDVLTATVTGATEFINASLSKMRLYNATSGQTGGIHIDEIKVYKKAINEPVVTFGSEQPNTQPEPTPNRPFRKNTLKTCL